MVLLSFLSKSGIRSMWHYCGPSCPCLTQEPCDTTVPLSFPCLIQDPCVTIVLLRVHVGHKSHVALLRPFVPMSDTRAMSQDPSRTIMLCLNQFSSMFDVGPVWHYCATFHPRLTQNTRDTIMVLLFFIRTRSTWHYTSASSTSDPGSTHHCFAFAYQHLITVSVAPFRSFSFTPDTRPIGL